MLKKEDEVDLSSLELFLSSKIYAFLYRCGVIQSFDRVFFLYCIFFTLTVTGAFVLDEFSLSVTVFSIVFAFLPTLLVLLIIDHRWKKRFRETFPEAIDIVVQSLKAAQPIKNSLMIARDLVSSPLRDEMTLIINEMDLGSPLTFIMRRASKRIGMEEFSFFSSSLVIQEQTGSSLADTLARLSEIVRSRTLMRLKIQSLSAELRMSAYILLTLIIFLLTFMSFQFRTNFEFFLFDSTGQMMGIVCLLMLITGFSIILKASRIKL